MLIDLFQFKAFIGEQTAAACIAYISKEFQKLNQNVKRDIYVHETCATDCKQVQFVIETTLDTILQANKKNAGLY
jgi:guanine nucleotide-binding protein G(i) subunit alpha